MALILRNIREKFDGIIESPSPVVSAGRFRAIAIDGTVTQSLGGTFPRHRIASIHPAVSIVGADQTTRIRSFYAFGRRDSDPNVFGTVHINRTRSFSLTPLAELGGLAAFTRRRGASIVGRVVKASVDILNILLTIGELTPGGHGKAYSARLIADGITYKIKAFAYNEPNNEAGETLEVTLVNPADRAAIEAAALFNFDIYDGTAWQTMFSGGKRSGVGFQIAFGDMRPNDTLTVSTVAPVAKKLQKSPEQNLTVYDSTRVTLHDADFQTIFDTAGGAYVQQLYPVAGLDLYTLLQTILVTKCGFTGFETTIPNYPIRRADFAFTGTFFDGLAGHIGMFKPIVFVKNDVVWLLDSTANVPAGFGSPAALNADRYQDAGITQTDFNIDGYLVKFDSELEYDYTSNRFVDDPVDIIGTSGSVNYHETRRSRTFRDYFKFSNPLVPVKSDKTQEKTTIAALIDGTLRTISEEVENISYDAFGRTIFILKEHSGLIPFINGTEEAAFFDIESEKTQFLYSADRFNPRRAILRQTIKEKNGIIVVDSTNKNLGKDFTQRFSEAFSAGNILLNMTFYFGPIQTVTETTTQTPKGQYEMRTKTVNFLTNPPQILNATTDARSGDMSTSESTGGTREIVVLRPGAARSDAIIRILAVSELPFNQAVALAHRQLARRSIKAGNVTLLGLALAFGRGVMFELFDRDGFSVAKFLCEGRSIAGQNLGQNSQATRQIVEITQI